MFVMLAAFNHPHPLIRALVALAFFGLFFALVGAALYARYRRQLEISARLKSMEEKLDRLASPSTPPASK